MLYSHDIDSALDGKVTGGLSQTVLDRELERARPALDKIRRWREDGTLPLLKLPARRDDLEALKPHAERFAKFEHVVVMGSGGSSLSGKTLVALKDQGFGPAKGRPKVHFMDNVDPATFEAMASRLPLDRTGFLPISKSGGTPETLTAFFSVLAALGSKAGKDNVIAITEVADNPLRRLATRLGCPILEHDPKVGGRYAALSVGLSKEKGTNLTVLMPYVDRLETFAFWYRQIWAESLGKEGKGTTPIRALGTVDQHSQVQLYLGGPRDKLFTLLIQDTAGQGARLTPAALGGDKALDYLAGHAMGDLLLAEADATAATLVKDGRPTRLIRIKTVDERVMGALMMHYMLETMFAAELWGIDAFDQPSVEDAKVLTRQYLSQRRKS